MARVISANHHLVQLSARLGDWRPDVVHAHDWQVAWAADTLANLHAARLVASFHTTERGRHGGRIPPGVAGAVHAVESWLAHRAAAVLTSSRFMVNEVIVGFELPAERVHLVPNGIDLAGFRFDADLRELTRRRLGLPEDAYVVGGVGRLAASKRFDVLIRALAQLPDDCWLLVVGGGAEESVLRRAAQRAGVADRVLLTGERPAAGAPGTDLPSLMNAMATRNKIFAPQAYVTLTGVTGGEITGQVVPVGRIRLQNLAFTNGTLIIADVPDFALWKTKSRPALLIGMDYLRQFASVTLDYRARDIRFELSAAPPQPLPGVSIEAVA